MRSECVVNHFLLELFRNLMRLEKAFRSESGVTAPENNPRTLSVVSACLKTNSLQIINHLLQTCFTENTVVREPFFSFCTMAFGITCSFPIVLPASGRIRVESITTNEELVWTDKNMTNQDLCLRKSNKPYDESSFQGRRTE